MMQTVGTPYYPMQATPSASAVNIQIFEPKAYSGQPTNNVANPIYAYPQQSMYSQPYMNQYQQYMPQAPMYMPQAQQVQQLPQQQMPAPLLTPQAPATEQAPQAPQATVEQQTPAQPDMQIQQPTEQNQNAVDVNSLVAGLKSTDNKTQEDAITKIANLSQGTPEMQSAVLSEPVMRGLADIVKQDTSSLQGPTEAQVAAINKAASGAKLTPEEEALTKELAPKTLADKNRVISMFTLAMLQKNQRDEVDRYNATQDPNNQLPQLKLNDLIGYTEIENAARNDNEKEVKLAAIQALSYVAKPEDKETIEPVLKAAMNDPEPLIQQAANEVLTNIGAAPQAAAGANDAQGAKQQEPVDLSKMSRKERKAYEKAQKQAEKEAAKAQKAA
ncbi:TPA: hypothetical protein IAA92_06695 [Candidatus Galligastranaerophilus intestinigallinarum]|nr:hypothetical protein [Candidatus Galligastranaerophilus intestinigallinarum]